MCIFGFSASTFEKCSHCTSAFCSYNLIRVRLSAAPRGAFHSHSKNYKVLGKERSSFYETNKNLSSFAAIRSVIIIMRSDFLIWPSPVGQNKSLKSRKYLKWKLNLGSCTLVASGSAIGVV